MKTLRSFKSLAPLAVAGVSLTAALNSQADHGPGTSGGGVLTQSAETLKPHTFSLELREDYTQFEKLTPAQIDAMATSAGGIDLLDHSFLSTVSLSYGVVENFQVGVTLGYYIATNAREVEYDAGTGDTETATFDPNGVTDLWLTGKYRFYRGPWGNFAVFGGMKFPTGRYQAVNSAGEPVEPSATAGSGSYDGMLGLTYSRFFTSRLSFDTSVQYTLRTEANSFQLGDRIEGGLAFAYRFSEDAQKFPHVTAFAEAYARHLFMSKDDGAYDPNTGGTTLFLTPGLHVSFTRNMAFTVSAPLPVFQDLNGEQLKTSFKVNGSLTFTF